MTWKSVVGIVVATNLVTVWITWVFLEVAKPKLHPPLQPVAALGLNEEKQVWNRIRVDDLGHVICAKP